MTVALVISISLAVGTPHLLSQSRLPARSGIALWLAILALRAALALSLATIALIYIPATGLFRLVTQWCLHGVIPFLTTHLGLDGHRFGDAAVLVPSLLVAGFSLSAAVGIWRVTRAARGWLRRSSLGSGPRHSLIVGGSEVLVAAAGLRDPRVVVSAGALVRLDDDELAAGLEHEWGHIAHRHRFFALLGHLFHGVSRFLPGSRRALELLHFQIEREADEYAIRQTGDSLALASAISKVATATAPASGPALALLGGGGVPERLRLLLANPERPGRLSRFLAPCLALCAVALALALMAFVPVLAVGDTSGTAAMGGMGPYDCT